MMNTKGPSNLYGNTRGTPTEHTNFPYAKDFNKNNNSINIHYKHHAHGVNVDNQLEYIAKAVNFANLIDRKNCNSFIDDHGSTHKYNTKTMEYSIIDNKGYIVTYFKAKNKNYFNNRKKKQERKKNEK